MAQIALHYTAAEIDAAIAKIQSLITTISGNIVQLYDGSNPIYPRTKAEAVFFNDDENSTLSIKEAALEGAVGDLGYKFGAKLSTPIIINGYYLNKNGELIPNSIYKVGTCYILGGTGFHYRATFGGSAYLHIYDINDNIIASYPGSSGINDYNIYIPRNASYIKFSYNSDSYILNGTPGNSGQVFTGSTDSSTIDTILDSGIYRSNASSDSQWVLYVGRKSGVSYEGATYNNVPYQYRIYLDDSLKSRIQIRYYINNNWINWDSQYIMTDQNINKVAPKCICNYDNSAKILTVYSYISGNIYLGVRIVLENHTDDLNYQYLWRLYDAYLYKHNSNLNFNKVIEDQLIDEGENEFAMLVQGKADHTGGYHGDERIDISNDSYVKFFLDGKELDITSNFTLAGEKFEYIQYSTLHETTTQTGSFVTGHPIIAKHYKRTSIENGFIKVYNTLNPLINLTMQKFYSGLVCVGVPASKKCIVSGELHTSVYNAQRWLPADQSSYEALMYGETNNIKCNIDSKVLRGFDSSTAPKYFNLWDRTTDLKYYGCYGSEIGQSATLSFAANSYIETLCNIKFSC